MNAIVSVSGGMDSAVCLFAAVKEHGRENVRAVSFYYGQKHDKELRYAKKTCSRLAVEHTVIDMSVFFNKDACALMKGSEEAIEQGKTYAEIMHDKVAAGEKPISDEYVPNRNSLMINILCTLGLQYFKNTEFELYVGVHSDDALKTEGSEICAYPDCSNEFIEATTKALEIATAGLCHIKAPLVNLTKAQVAMYGLSVGMLHGDFDNTWSCYVGGDKQCGLCPTCRDRIKALREAGVYRTIADITKRYDIDSHEASKYF